MSKKDPGEKDTYIIKTEDGYVVVMEGEKGDRHIGKRDRHFGDIDRLVNERREAGVKLSKLLKAKFGLTAMSNVGATHTTGAGDYDEKTAKKKRKKK